MPTPAFPTPYTAAGITFRDLTPVSLNNEPAYTGYQAALPVGYYELAGTNHSPSPAGLTYPIIQPFAAGDNNPYSGTPSPSLVYLH